MAGESSIEKIISPASGQELPRTETGPSLEKGPEKVFLKNKEKDEQEKILAKIKQSVAGASSLTKDWEVKRAAEIDKILATGLNEIFLKMSPQEQAVFKKTGEETVAKINVLLSETKVKVRKIIELIKKWLKLIPGVNRFFLEQEAKIKADKIVNLKNKF